MASKSTNVIGLENLTPDEVRQDIANGGKFVIYQYVISLIVLTFMRPSKVHYIRSTESAAKKGMKFTLLTAFFGWWGIPWGPIRSVKAIQANARGGKDITAEVLAPGTENSITRGCLASPPRIWGISVLIPRNRVYRHTTKTGQASRLPCMQVGSDSAVPTAPVSAAITPSAAPTAFDVF